jgi:hypothetical protein
MAALQIPERITTMPIRTSLALSVLLLAPLLAGAQAPSSDMRALMLRGHEKMMEAPMTGDPDVDFAVAMREHHVGALDMAQWELDHGKDPAMKAMARKIMADQKKEIAQFDAFLERAGRKHAQPGIGVGDGRSHAHPGK